MQCSRNSHKLTQSLWNLITFWDQLTNLTIRNSVHCISFLEIIIVPLSFSSLTMFPADKTFFFNKFGLHRVLDISVRSQISKIKWIIYLIHVLFHKFKKSKSVFLHFFSHKMSFERFPTTYKSYIKKEIDCFCNTWHQGYV